MSSTSSKDSTDLALHLRTVHFSLCVACVVLLVATTQDRTGAAARAYSDLERIIVLTESWDSDWLRQYAIHVRQQKVDNGTISATRLPASITVTPPHGKPLRLDIDARTILVE